MSRFRFSIEDWVQGDDSDPRRANTCAEFTLFIDDIPATRLLDNWSRTVTDKARLPLYPMAEWFAANWWRLHVEAPYESGGRPPVEWRLSHDLPAIAGGYIWPRIRFASDDLSIQISARAIRGAPWEPVRHINDVLPARAVPTEDFDAAIEELIGVVLSRLNDLGVSAEPLATIWANVLEERRDSELSDWRSWEARLGCDPDEAPEALMGQLDRLFSKAGKAAAAEVAPLLAPHKSSMLRKFEALAVAPGLEAHLPHAAAGFQLTSDDTPWNAGRELARGLRAEFGQPDGPLSNETLNDLLGTKRNAFDDFSNVEAPLGLAVRFPNQGKSVLHFRKRNLPGRRFEAARFIGDSLSASASDLWLPLTDRATARQKLQRAFAAELLAPIDDISDQVRDARTSEQFEDLGERYGVSPLAIRSHLANHGLLSPDEVTA